MENEIGGASDTGGTPLLGGAVVEPVEDRRGWRRRTLSPPGSLARWATELQPLAPTARCHVNCPLPGARPCELPGVPPGVK